MTEGQREDLNRTPRRRDGLLGRLRERVGLDPHGAGQLAPAQDLDEGALVGEPVLVERRRTELVEPGRLDGVEVDALVLDPERVLEALQLRDSALEGHLATLEAGRHLAAGLLALHAPAGGLAALAGDAA